MIYFAHSTDRADRSDWQPLHIHLNGVGDGAATRACKFGAAAPAPALLAGRAHDLGKYCEAFQRRLTGSPRRVDHSTAGAREVLGAAAGADRLRRWMAELVAYAIAGHHAGLPDRTGGPSSLQGRPRGVNIGL